MQSPDTGERRGKLSGIQFMPGVAVAVGGKWIALMYWDRVKHFEEPANGHKIRVEELKNGDVRVSTDNGWSRLVSPWAIAWRMYEPEGKK